MAALRAGHTVGLGRSGSRPRPDLHPRRPLGRICGPGGAHPGDRQVNQIRVHRLRALLSVAAAVVVGLALTGCGSNDNSNNNADGETAHTEPVSGSTTGGTTARGSLADAKVQLTPIADVRAPV